MLDLSARVFYKARFDVESTSGHNLLSLLVDVIRTWASWRYRQNVHFWNWIQFQKYGDFEDAGKVVSATTSSFIPEDQSDEQYWACKISEFQRKENTSPRTWTTEIGFVQKSKERATISFVVYYSDSPGFIGELEPSPTLNTPSIVRKLLNHQYLKCYSKDIVLTDKASQLHVGDALDFINNVLCAENRGVPIIYISPLGKNNEPKRSDTFPSKLMDNVAGNALVYYSDDDDFIDELDYFLDRSYRCYPGSIRIYMPNIRKSESGDCYRHRYISGDEFSRIGEGHVITMLRRAFSQDIRSYDSRTMFRINDCKELYQRSQYLKLRIKLDSTVDSLRGTSENISEYAQLLKMADDELNKADSEISHLQSQLSEYSSENESLKRDNRKIDAERASLSTQLSSAHESLRCIKTMQESIPSLCSLPETNEEIAKFLECAFFDRIRFTDQAWRSIKESKTKPKLFWKCIYDIANTLHELHKSNCMQIELDFKHKTGLEWARGEGMQTRSNPNLMSMRVDEYNGRKIFIESHVKKGNKENADSIRVYYDYLSDENLIIIGYCGLHLPNHSSLKMA